MRFHPQSKVCIGNIGVMVGNVGHRSFRPSNKHAAGGRVDIQSTLLLGRVGVGTIHSRCPPSARFLSTYSSLKLFIVSRLTN